MTEVGDLIGRGLLEEVPSDRETALVWVRAAERHLAAARQILDLDREGAYSLTYDATRKALAALMLAEGYRAKAVPGSHRAVAQYAERLEAPDEVMEHLRQADRIRRNRNRSEYGIRTFGAEEVNADLAHATSIVVFAEATLRS